LGGGESLARMARDVLPPRLPTLRRTALLTVLFALLVTTVGSLCSPCWCRQSEQRAWIDAAARPVSAQHIASAAMDARSPGSRRRQIAAGACSFPVVQIALH
jgi:hypothetical protein